MRPVSAPRPGHLVAPSPDTGMSDGRRAFCMGNVLVTGIPRRIGQALMRSISAEGGGEPA